MINEKQKKALGRVEEIKARQRELDEEIHRLMCDAFPEGCIVRVRLGRATVTGKVVAHNSYA